ARAEVALAERVRAKPRDLRRTHRLLVEVERARGRIGAEHVGRVVREVRPVDDVTEVEANRDGPTQVAQAAGRHRLYVRADAGIGARRGGDVLHGFGLRRGSRTRPHA